MNITWDAKGYTSGFAFVHQYGEDVLGMIDAAPGSHVVDLGCGSGALSEKLLARGYRVTAIDASEEMLAQARAMHPDIPFAQADATDFTLPEPADVIFSNAVFHWIDRDRQPLLAASIARNLKTGGQLVCEFGGYGCAERVHSALEHAFAARGLVYPRVFYFPTIAEHAPILEAAGLRVTCALLFDRPTPQQGEDGLRNWIHMFVKAPFEGMPDDMREAIISEAADSLRPTLRQEDGTWIVDYVRIRIKAVKV